ncbi:MAG: proton-conducting transporter transmembrane domain-containing protein [Vulcanimicrobiaceae bacterium]
MTGALWAYAAVFAICAVGAVVAFLVPVKRVAASIAWFAGAAALLACAAGAQALLAPESSVSLWNLPTLGPMILGTTHLGALFTCIAALVYFPVSVYTAGYLQRYEEHYSPRSFALWYYAALAAVMAIFIARDLVSFFIAWEIMAIASAALVAYEWRERANARAAYVMLAMSEAGTLAAMIAMLLIFANAHSLRFVDGSGSDLSGATRWAVFLLSFFGFGVKAGLMPFNSWLPRAHPVAPGNISALLSGVVLNLGVYGILLVNLVLAPVSFVGFGALALIVGAVSALAGILYATISDDLKTMLAYSSVENIGIAIAAIGAGFVFVAVHQPALAAIGLAAGLYHVLNHSAYKGLLFLGASTVHAQTGQRSIDRLGGLIRLLPVTAFCFFIGALSISAIPPFNGFASEWLVLESLLRSAELAPPWLRVVFSLSGATIALTAALAITCFVKAFGMTFLGVSRMHSEHLVKEAPRSMLSAMYVLASACALLGFLPTFVLAVINAALSPSLGGSWVQRTLVPAFFGTQSAADHLPPDFVRSFHALGAQLAQGVVPGRGLVVMLRGGHANPVVFAMSSTYLVLTLLLFLGAAYFGVRVLARARRHRTVPVWAGGLSSLPPVMTYTGTGFSNPVRVIFNAIFRPSREDERKTIHEHFRDAIRRAREDVFLADRVVAKPAIVATLAVSRTLARMHHGRLPAYVGYALAALLVALAISLLT